MWVKDVSPPPGEPKEWFWHHDIFRDEGEWKRTADHVFFPHERFHEMLAKLEPYKKDFEPSCELLPQLVEKYIELRRAFSGGSMSMIVESNKHDVKLLPPGIDANGFDEQIKRADERIARALGGVPMPTQQMFDQSDAQSLVGRLERTAKRLATQSVRTIDAYLRAWVEETGIAPSEAVLEQRMLEHGGLQFVVRSKKSVGIRECSPKMLDEAERISRERERDDRRTLQRAGYDIPQGGSLVRWLLWEIWQQRGSTFRFIDRMNDANRKRDELADKLTETEQTLRDVRADRDELRDELERTKRRAPE